MEKEVPIKDVEFIAEWRSMLNTFSEIVKDKPPVEKVKADLEELIEAVKITALLTGHQRDAIITRCKNYMNGNYGKDKIKADYLSNKTV